MRQTKKRRWRRNQRDRRRQSEIDVSRAEREGESNERHFDRRFIAVVVGLVVCEKAPNVG